MSRAAQQKRRRLQPGKHVLGRLQALSGNQCAFGGCTRPIYDGNGRYVGQLAHIEGVFGERFNDGMTSNDLRSFENLMFLCYEHHRATDDEAVWTVERMRQLKAAHEAEVRSWVLPLILVGNIPLEPKAFISTIDVQRVCVATAPGSVVVVTGPRGAGKSQAAGACARAAARRQNGLVAWINAESRETLVSGLAELAKRLGIHDPDQESVSVVNNLRLALAERRIHGHIILDNADDVALMRDVVPTVMSVSVLITTTKRSMACMGEEVYISGYSRNEGVEFLQSAASMKCDTFADEILVELALLPVALAQAASTIRRHRLTFEKYLSRLLGHRLSEVLVANLAGDDYPRSTADAIVMAFDDIKQDPALFESWKMMRIVCWLSSDGVSRALLHRGCSVMLSSDEAAVDESLALGVEQSIFDWTDDGSCVRMHRLIARVLREKENSEGAALAAAEAAVLTLEACRAATDNSWGDRGLGRELAIQVIALCQRVGEITDMPVGFNERVVALGIWAAMYLQNVFDYRLAVDVASQVNGYSLERLGEGNPLTWEISRRLGWSLTAGDRYPDARAVLDSSLHMMIESLGAEHREVLSAQKDLAACIRDAGRHEEACEMAQRVVDRCEEILGPNDTITISARSCLAYAFQTIERFDESLEQFLVVVSRRAHTLGSDAEKTLGSRRALAAALLSAGRVNEAVCELRGLLLRVEGLDSASDLTVLTRNNLAHALVDAGELSEAAGLFEITYRARLLSLGSDHPLTVDLRISLARVYESLGRTPEALNMLIAMAEIRAVTLGPDDPASQWGADEVLEFRRRHGTPEL